MKRVIDTEWLKLKASGIWMPMILLPILGVAVGSGNYYANRQAFSMPEWYALWTQVSLFFGYFFYPILMAICAAYLWRMEHHNYNWNRFMTFPLPASKLLAGKLFLLGALALAVQIFLILLYWLVGRYGFGFTTDFPLAEAMERLFFGWLSALAVTAMQFYLSMRIRSFALPIGMSLGFSIIGLMCYSLGISLLFPNSILILGFNSNFRELFSLIRAIGMIGASFFYVALFLFLAIAYLRKRDISAS